MNAPDGMFPEPLLKGNSGQRMARPPPPLLKQKHRKRWRCIRFLFLVLWWDVGSFAMKYDISRRFGNRCCIQARRDAHIHLVSVLNTAVLPSNPFPFHRQLCLCVPCPLVPQNCIDWIWIFFHLIWRCRYICCVDFLDAWRFSLSSNFVFAWTLAAASNHYRYRMRFFLLFLCFFSFAEDASYIANILDSGFFLRHSGAFAMSFWVFCCYTYLFLRPAMQNFISRLGQPHSFLFYCVFFFLFWRKTENHRCCCYAAPFGFHDNSLPLIGSVVVVSSSFSFSYFAS